MIRIVALIERYYHCKGSVNTGRKRLSKVMNETFGERRLRREHLRRIITTTPQRNTFFASSVCLAQTQKVAFRSEESSLLPSKVSRQNTPIGNTSSYPYTHSNAQESHFCCPCSKEAWRFSGSNNSNSLELLGLMSFSFTVI